MMMRSAAVDARRLTATGVEFRLDSGLPASPSAGINWTDYEITLARAANALPGTGSPRSFGGTIVFDTPCTYQGGALDMLLTHTNGRGGATPTVDRVQTDSAGMLLIRRREA